MVCHQPDLILCLETNERLYNLTSLSYAMDNHRYAHKVATFMQQYFQFRLAQATGLGTPLSTPAVPKAIDTSLHHACLFAVERCLCAFTNPGTIWRFMDDSFHPLPSAVYVDWDYESYCEDCTNRHLSNGGNSAKEEALCDDWETRHRNTLRIQRAATIVDLKDRIIGWILPEVLLPSYQVLPTFRLEHNLLITCLFCNRINCIQQ